MFIAFFLLLLYVLSHLIGLGYSLATLDIAYVDRMSELPPFLGLAVNINTVLLTLYKPPFFKAPSMIQQHNTWS